MTEQTSAPTRPEWRLRAADMDEVADLLDQACDHLRATNDTEATVALDDVLGAMQAIARAVPVASSSLRERLDEWEKFAHRASPHVTRFMLDMVADLRAALAAAPREPEAGSTALPKDQKGPRAMTLLTPRERQVVTLIAAGKRNREIARHLGVTTSTTKNHVHAALRKLGKRNRVEVAAFVHRLTQIVREGSRE